MLGKKILILFLLGIIGGRAEAQIFKPFTFLRVIQTDHFEIIYPHESEQTARTLALFADRMYERISGLLGITLDQRLPVTITPHTDAFNGYMNPLPYPHIVLFDTSMNPEWTAFENSLESLFFHELTHAVTLSSRSPFFGVLHKIFGGWVYPTGITAPLFMVEGAAVSFESLDGYGRANDPLIKERLRQAIHEDAFLSPFQASGVYDLPPAGSVYYEYGGLFSAWLQKKYGMEKYAELWQAMGRDYHFSFNFYNNGFFNIFQKVYGLAFPESWEDFKDELRLKNIEDNPSGIIGGGKLLIGDIAAAGDKVFFLNKTNRQVSCYDPVSQTVKNVAPADSAAYALDAAQDGRFLISSYRYDGQLAQAVVTEWDGYAQRTWKGLYNGRYFRNGLIGLSSNRHVNNLVFRFGPGGPGEDTEKTLLRGNADFLYSNPRTVNDVWIAFTAVKKGKRQLCLYNYETTEVYRLASDLEDDGERWRYIRGLQFSGGRLLFGFNHDDGMYKLGVVELSGLLDGSGPSVPEAVFTGRNFSGGIFIPVIVKDTIYYRGAFATWDALMKYPEGIKELSGKRAPLRLIPWTEADRTAAGLPAVASNSGEALFPPDNAGPDSSGTPESRFYLPLKYLNPLKLWFPVPLIRSNGDEASLDGGGIFSFMTDPADGNLIFLSAAMDVRFLMAASEIQWTNLSLGFPLDIYFSDDIDKTQANIYRRTQGSLSGLKSFELGGGHQISLASGIGMSLLAADPEDDSSAYTWTYEEGPYYNVMFGIEYSNLRRFAWELFGQGAVLSLYTRFPLQDSPTLRFEGSLKAAFESFFPLQMSLYGVWDQNGMNLHGESRQYSASIFSDIAPFEYNTQGIAGLTWLGGGEAEIKLFSLEIQNNISHLYFNRIFSTLAYRGAFYQSRQLPKPAGTAMGEDYHLTQSLILRLGGSISTVFVTALPLTVTPRLWGAWKISNIDDDEENDFAFGISYSVSW
jgi:hypothetical protein